VLAVDESLTKLFALDPEQARITELRFFGGLTVEETAEVIGTSVSTVKREWTMAKAWLTARYPYGYDSLFKRVWVWRADIWFGRNYRNASGCEAFQEAPAGRLSRLGIFPVYETNGTT
jgi:ECF sigma factor